jgi:hypothetical protein
LLVGAWGGLQRPRAEHETGRGATHLFCLNMLARADACLLAIVSVDARPIIPMRRYLWSYLYPTGPKWRGMILA